MIDKLIIKLAVGVSKLISPSTILKLMFVALILSLFLSFLLGYWVIIITLVVNNLVWLVTEFLYATEVEINDNEK